MCVTRFGEVVSKVLGCRQVISSWTFLGGAGPLGGARPPWAGLDLSGRGWTSLGGAGPLWAGLAPSGLPAAVTEVTHVVTASSSSPPGFSATFLVKEQQDGDGSSAGRRSGVVRTHTHSHTH